MKENRFELSRRSVLAGLGTAGLASAGAGLGTSAYFSDTESFDGNALVAGELDMVVDWQQGYYGPEGFEHVNAYPDGDGDGVQDFDPKEAMNPCTQFASVEDLASGEEPTSPIVERPLVQLDDVKPGDWGEITFSLHLCRNPGYVWMVGEEIENAEDGLEEPEQAMGDSGPDGELAENIDVTMWYDNDCDNRLDRTVGGEDVDIVLAFDRSGSMDGTGGTNPDKLDQAIQGAKALVDSLGSNAQLSLATFGDYATRDHDLADVTTNRATIKSSIDDIDPGDGGNLFSTGTNITDAIEVAREELLGSSIDTDGDDATINGETNDDPLDAEIEPSGNDRDGVEKVLILLSDGEPQVFDTSSDAESAATAAKDAGIEMFTIAYGSDANAEFLSTLASGETTAEKQAHSFVAPTPDDIVRVFSRLGSVFAGEEVIFEGSMADALDLLGDGIPLDGDLETPFEEVVENAVGDSSADGRECHDVGLTYCIAMKWELPFEVGNEVQSDSLTFDVGFYTEQCRHNDGTGSAAGNASSVPPR